MPVICWAPLAKSASDPTTIAEYISSNILIHNADINAHGLDGYALYVHRSAEYIDHLVYSITLDRLDNFIAKGAFLYNREVVLASLESIDAWNKSGGVSGQFGNLNINMGSTPYSIAWANTDAGILPNVNKNFIWSMIMKAQQSQHHKLNVNCGTFEASEVEANAIGFKFDNTYCYAFHTYATGINKAFYFTGLGDVAVGSKTAYRVEFEPATNIKFYIDNVLRATHEKSLPVPEWLIHSTFAIQIYNSGASPIQFNFNSLFFSQER